MLVQGNETLDFYLTFINHVFNLTKTIKIRETIFLQIFSDKFKDNFFSSYFHCIFTLFFAFFFVK